MTNETSSSNIITLAEYKYNRLTLDDLLVEAEQHAQIVARGNLNKFERHRCNIVFKMLHDKATTSEIKDLMKVLIRIMRFF